LGGAYLLTAEALRTVATRNYPLIGGVKIGGTGPIAVWFILEKQTVKRLFVFAVEGAV
jgi:hypothetical protein